MNKLKVIPVFLCFTAIFLILTSPQSSFAQSELEKKQVKECIKQGQKHIERKHNINRIIKSFDSQIPSSKKYDGFLITVHRNLTYAILVCGEPSLKNFQVGVFDENQKGVKGAKSHDLKGAWVSLLTWKPEKEGSYLIVVFSLGGKGGFNLTMMVK